MILHLFAGERAYEWLELQDQGCEVIALDGETEFGSLGEGIEGAFHPLRLSFRIIWEYTQRDASWTSKGEQQGVSFKRRAPEGSGKTGSARNRGL